MNAELAALPNDIDALKAALLVARAEAAAAVAQCSSDQALIAHLKLEIAKLNRDRFGPRSERTARLLDQMEFQLEELEASATEDELAAEVATGKTGAVAAFTRTRPARRPLPAHLPRERVVEPAPSACLCCGGARLAKLGEDVTEVLDYVPGHFQVIRHVRPKYACRACDAITQAPAPAMPTPCGRATPAMLAHLLVSKYCDHLPLYRQCEIYARQGLELDRSTLCDWVGQAAWLLDPIVAAIRAHVFAAEKIHGDDTTVPVLSPGLGRTKTGRLWAYVRDDRPFCGGAAPAVAYFYSPDRTGAHPAAHHKPLLWLNNGAGASTHIGRIARPAPSKAGSARCTTHRKRPAGRLRSPTFRTGLLGKVLGKSDGQNGQNKLSSCFCLASHRGFEPLLPP